MAESRVDAGINFDVSQLAEGSAATVEGLQSIAEQATVTSETMKSKSQAMADAAKEAAGVVTAADLRIAEASRAASLAKKEQLQASRDLAKGLGNENDALILSAVAMNKARAASLELAAAQEAVAVASHATVTGVQATSGAIRSLEGNAGIRAVENFVSKTLGLGPLMQGLFPLIGAAAFGEILLGMGEKLYEVGLKAAEASESIKAAFGDLHAKAEITNDDLRITDDKLKDEIAKLSGHPGDGLQTALDEAIKRADQLLESLTADNKAIQQIFKDNAVGSLAGFWANVEPTGTQTRELEQDNKDLIKAVQAARVEYFAALKSASTAEEHEAAAAQYAKAVHDATQKKIDAYKAEMVRLRKEESDSAAASLVNGADRNVDAPVVNNSAKLENLQGVINTLQVRMENEDIADSTLKDQKTVGKLKQDKALDGGGSKDKESQGMKDMIRQMEVDAETAKRIHESLTEIFEADLRQQDEASRKSAQQQRADAQQFRRDQAAKVEAISEATQAALEDAQGRAAVDAEAISANLAEGMITKLGAAKQLAAVHTTEYIAKLKALKAELDALSNGYGGSIDPKKSDHVQGEINKTETQQTVTAGKDKAAITNAVAKPYLDAFNHIDQGWRKVQTDLIAGNKNIQRDFAQMGVSLVQSLAMNFEEMVAKHLAAEIRMRVAHLATTQMGVATDAAGAAQSDSISMISALKQMSHAAAVAAGKAWSALADIPIIGPELGAVAAAATYAGVMALAAFEQGGIVGGAPGMAVPILAHAGERVLSPSQTNKFESMVNNSSATQGGSTVHLHYEPKINAYDRSGMRSTLQSHSGDILDIVRQGMNTGKLARR